MSNYREMYLANNRGSVGSGLTGRRSGLNWFQHFIRVSDLHKALQQKPIGHFGAYVAILAWTISFKKVLALPTIILDFNRGHTREAFVNWPSP